MAYRKKVVLDKQAKREEALVRYFRPIMKRFLRLATPAVLQSEESMQETFAYRPRKRSHNKQDGDDRSGRVLIMEVA